MESSSLVMIKVLKIIKKENPDSAAIGLLEDALKQSMKYNVLDMANLGSVISMQEVEKEFRNGLVLLQIMNEDKASGGGQEGNG